MPTLRRYRTGADTRDITNATIRSNNILASNHLDDSQNRLPSLQVGGELWRSLWNLETPEMGWQESPWINDLRSISKRLEHPSLYICSGKVFISTGVVCKINRYSVIG